MGFKTTCIQSGLKLETHVLSHLLTMVWKIPGNKKEAERSEESVDINSRTKPRFSNNTVKPAQEQSMEQWKNNKSKPNFKPKLKPFLKPEV